MGIASPPSPSPNIPTPPAAHPPVLASTFSQGAATSNKAKAAGGTIKTSPQGDLQQTAMAKSTLLGG
jgi:hypothetical protein